MEKLLLTEQEARELLGVSRTMMWKLRRSGELAPVRINKRAIRYRLSDLEDFVTRNREVVRHAV